jgi:AcrR family transcriptional regulator
LSKSQKSREPRADARRNRQRLLDTALKLFTSSKGEVTLSAVAEGAGVGIGTLYRHFPTRDALVEAIYRDEVDRLAEAAPALLKEMPADEALEAWLTRYAGLIATKRGLMEVVRSIFESGAEAPAYSRERMREAVTLLLDAAARTGRVRGDLDPADVLLAVAASTWTVAGDGNWEERVRPVLRIIVDGLRYKPG